MQCPRCHTPLRGMVATFRHMLAIACRPPIRTVLNIERIESEMNGWVTTE